MKSGLLTFLETFFKISNPGEVYVPAFGVDGPGPVVDRTTGNTEKVKNTIDMFNPGYA